MQKIIDVSEHNGHIDWAKVKESGAHAIIRCGYGQDIASQDDKRWFYNASECARLGIPFGAYLYSYAVTESQVLGEVDHAVRLCKLYRDAMAYPLYFDSEEKKTAARAAVNAVIFCSNIANEGFTPGVYASQSWWQDYLPNLPKSYSRWVARWSDKEPNVAWEVWQYSNKGDCPGVPATSEGGVDVNWGKMAVSAPEVEIEVADDMATVDELAQMCLEEKLGDGVEREKELGGLYACVQTIVNARLGAPVNRPLLAELAAQVADGMWGNGVVRSKALGSAYDIAQDYINSQ